MKLKTIQYILLALNLLSVVGCNLLEKEDLENEMMAIYPFEGEFKTSTHPTSGIAKISKDKSQLIFENFKSDDGPDLNIYLVSDLKNISKNHIDLGDIKGLNGNYSYPLGTSIDFQKYKYIVVWCVDFDVNFGYAELMPKN